MPGRLWVERRGLRELLGIGGHVRGGAARIRIGIARPAHAVAPVDAEKHFGRDLIQTVVVVVLFVRIAQQIAESASLHVLPEHVHLGMQPSAFSARRHHPASDCARRVAFDQRPVRIRVSVEALVPERTFRIPFSEVLARLRLERLLVELDQLFLLRVVFYPDSRRGDEVARNTAFWTSPATVFESFCPLTYDLLAYLI